MNRVVTRIKNTNISSLVYLTDENKISLILVHGLGMSGNYFIPLAEKLKKNFNVFIPDLPGFGESEKPAEILNIKELSYFIAEYIKLKNINKPVLVGNSMGCQIIAEITAGSNSIASKIILQGPTIAPNQNSLSQQLVKFIRNIPEEKFSLKIIAVKNYFSSGIWRIYKTFRLAQRNNIEENLLKIEIPTLIVRGEDDPIVDAGWAEEAVKKLKRGKLVTLKNASHAGNYDEPEEFSKIIKNFIKES